MSNGQINHYQKLSQIRITTKRKNGPHLPITSNKYKCVSRLMTMRATYRESGLEATRATQADKLNTHKTTFSSRSQLSTRAQHAAHKASGDQTNYYKKISAWLSRPMNSWNFHWFSPLTKSATASQKTTKTLQQLTS